MGTDISRTPKPVQIGNRTVKITGRVREAVSLMVWNGLKRDDAAKAVGLQPNSLYVAMRKPDVKSLYLIECESFRLSGKARRLHRLEEIAASDRNLNAAVAAIRVAESLEPDPTLRSGMVTSPGLVITIVNPAPVRPVAPTIDITPVREPRDEPPDAA
jgi:hypothetical protein